MVKKLKRFIESEIKGWSKFDIIWLSICTIVILGLSVYWRDSIIDIISAITGVWYVILTGKGKRSSFIFGVLNILTYSYVAYQVKYYGEVMLNMLYYLPMNFVGWFVWKKYMDNETGEVIKRSLSKKKSIIIYGATLVGIFVYGLILDKMGGKLPYIDSISTVISVTAQILSIWRLKEQWILWIVVNSVTIFMWGVNFSHGRENVSMLLMWGMYLLNAIIMYVSWNKDVKEKE